MLKCFCEDPMPLDSEDIYATKCGHVFHYGCLLQWLEQKAECPTCRTRVGGLDKFRLYLTLSDDTNDQQSIVNDTLESLEVTQAQLNEITEMCQRKDNTIEKLKNSKSDARIMLESKAMENIIQSHSDWASLDYLFNDPKHFDNTVNSVISRLREDNPDPNPSDVAASTSAARATCAASAADNNDIPDTAGSESDPLEEMYDDDAAIRFSLDTLGQMISRIS